MSGKGSRGRALDDGAGDPVDLGEQGAGHRAGRDLEGAQGLAVIGDDERRRGRADQAPRRGEREAAGEGGRLAAKELDVKLEVHGLVGAQLGEAVADVAGGQGGRDRAVEGDPDDLGGEQHEQLGAHAREPAGADERLLGPVAAQERATHRADDVAEDPRVASLLAHEQLEGDAVVIVDAGQRDAIDLASDPPLAGLADLKARKRAQERGPPRLRDPVAVARRGGERTERVAFEVGAPG
ncbi:MAG: hypothetical protein KC636_38185 [Myxococcales bacterium]|nr:hypothetical protein [Myxococcales bacterium]